MTSLPLEHTLLFWFRTSEQIKISFINTISKGNCYNRVCVYYVRMFEFSLPTVGSYCYWFGQWWPMDHSSKKSRWPLSLNQWCTSLCCCCCCCCFFSVLWSCRFLCVWGRLLYRPPEVISVLCTLHLVMYAGLISCCYHWATFCLAVNNHWTGLLEWTPAWTDSLPFEETVAGLLQM